MMKILLISILSLLVPYVSLNIHGFHTNAHNHTEEYYDEIKGSRKKEVLYVHLIPHSHNDVGWLKTVDGYYSGTNTQDNRAIVSILLSTTIEELIKDPKKRFTYVEMKFFSKWFYDQTEMMQEEVRTLVKEGRLEFVNGGWSMHDEACTHYEDQINNMMIGHEFLLKEFGVKPRVGWHIDPFGHSNANPRLFAEMGFDAWFFARLDF